MKKLKNVFILLLLLLITINVTARSVTYQRLSEGTLIEKPETKPKVVYETTLHFLEQCPTITDEQVKILIDSGSVIVNKNLRIGYGKYSSNLLYFTPQYKIERLVITNSNNDVRRTFSVMDGKTMISEWFIFGIISIILFNLSLYFLKKSLVTNKAAAAAAAVVAAAAVAAAVVAVVAAVAVAAAVAAVAAAVVVAVAAVAAVVVVETKTEKEVKIFRTIINIFTILMIIFMVLCYFQI